MYIDPFKGKVTFLKGGFSPNVLVQRLERYLSTKKQLLMRSGICSTVCNCACGVDFKFKVAQLPFQSTVVED